MVCQGEGRGGKDKASMATAAVNWTQTVGSDQVLFGNPRVPILIYRQRGWKWKIISLF